MRVVVFQPQHQPLPLAHTALACVTLTPAVAMIQLAQDNNGIVQLACVRTSQHLPLLQRQPQLLLRAAMMAMNIHYPIIMVGA